MTDPTPPEPSRLDELLGEVAEKFLKRSRLGELPDVEDYATAHPEIASAIRHLLPLLQDLSPEALTAPPQGDQGSTSALQDNALRSVPTFDSGRGHSSSGLRGA